MCQCENGISAGYTDQHWNAAFAQEDAAIGYTAGLTSVTIPQAVTAIQSYAFYHTAIAEVTVPASVETWGKYVFSDCTKLKTAVLRVIPLVLLRLQDVQHVQPYDFSKLQDVRTKYADILREPKTITYEGTIAQWNAITKPVNLDVLRRTFLPTII